MPTYPAALRPDYPMSEADDPVKIYDGTVEVIRASGESVSGRGVLMLEWLPETRIAFTISLDREIYLQKSEGTLNVRLLENDRIVQLVPRRFSIGHEPTLTGELKPFRFVAGDSKRLKFQVANLGDWRGTRIQSTLADGSPVDYCGRLELSGCNWKLTLDGIAEFHARQSGGLRDEFALGAGFAFTHAGCVEKVDGSAITDSEADEILVAIQHFLSFMQGRRTPLVFPIGVDANDAIVWEEWAPVPGTPWRNVPSWMPEHHVDLRALNTAFANFLSLWALPRWRDSLLTVLHWYLESNEELPPRPETAIALSQISLELLSFLILVKKDTVMSRSAYDTLGATTKIENLLDHYGISKDIPASMSALQAFAGNKQGPEALVSIRNDIIHPKFNKELTPSLLKARFQASKLGLLYAEVIILRMLDYTGNYTNRIKKLESPII